MCRKLIFLTSFVLVLALVSTNVTLGDVVDIRISAGTDDAEEAVNPGNQDTYNTSSDLEIPNDNDHNGGMQFIGLNFRDISIAPGQKIDSAYIEFVCDASKFGEGDVYLLIWGHLAPNPDGFANPTPTTISDRPRTQAKVAWEPEQWTAAGQISQTVDISSIIQELIDQGGWAAGNAIEIIIGEDTSKDPFTGFRNAESFNGSAALAPLLHIEFISKVAIQPVPADGAVEVDVITLEWIAADTAVSHKVYLSTDATIDESDFLAEAQMALQFADLAPGTTYYWRVDEVEADGTVNEGATWSFATLAIEAHFPDPEDGAEDVALDAQLSWTAGKDAIMHDVYFGTDPAALLPVSMMKMETSFDPGPLEPFTTYYWKVDEFAIIVTNPGPVWSFSTPKYLVIDDDETTLDYDNSAEPYVSEVSWDTPQDLTTGGLADLTLRFHGKPGSEGSVSLDEATGTYTMTGSGADVWGTADEFHFGYRELTGDAVMVAHVVDNGTGSNNWAKGGVMIRQSLEAGSTHALMAITGSDGGGGAFQWRPAADGDSSSAHDDAAGMAPGYWVKLERVGNALSGSYSPDGVTWTQQGDAQTIEMTDPVLIGLFVTSHQSGEKRTYTFDNVDIDGNISADTASTDIGIAGNAVEPLYVALEDSTGAVASVTHPYAAAVQIDAWRQWTIPLSKFSGVDPTNAAKLYVGVGDGEPGGSGSIRIEGIRVVMSATAANIILVSGNHDFDLDGVVDDFMLRDILEAEGHTVDYQPGNWTELDDGKIAALNAADLVIISRTTNSGDYDDGDEPTQWNSITTPMIVSSTHLMRSSRWKLVDSTSLLDLVPAVMELADGSQIQAMDEAVGLSSFIDAAPGNGTVLATGDGLPWIIEWEAGVEYYDGAGQTAGGPRVFFVAGTQELEGVSNWGEWNLTPAGQAIYMDVVNKLLPAVELDVTVPGDIVQGVPNDGLMVGNDFGWPGAETPDLAIDDNTGTKFLHFKGELEPTGFQVTPLNGPSIVTGLTLTTANDEPPRDPVTFELYGSNDSIDGPYELIASGDIVDFAQATAWPRFTKNETPISFENDSGYGHYQVLFPAVRDAGSANSMQIAEVELIGVPAPAGPIVHYKLDDGEGVIAVDSSNGLDGILMGDPQWSAGIIGGALDFDGDGDYVDCGTNAKLNNLSDAITVSAWVSIRSVTTTWMGIVMKGETAWRLGVNGDTTGIHWSFTGGDRGWQAANSVTELPLDEWHHIAGTYERSVGGTVYVDGVAETVNPDPDGVRTNEMPLLLGENPEALGRLFDGLLDDVRIYDRALSADEISGLTGPSVRVYYGGALDDTWDHDNGSDQWDGTGPGEGMPGGAVALTEDGVTFLRIQDTGDPRDYGMSDPGSNRKVYLTRLTDISLDGLRLEVRARVATTAPLDDMHPDGGAGVAPWPAEGIGYHIRDGGKGMFGVSDGVGIISFSLAQPGEIYLEDVTTDVLVMNNLVGTDPTSDVDTEDAAAAVAMNMIAIDDATQWNTFAIDIVAGGAGTHVVSVSVNDGPAELFDVTLGSDLEADGPFITIGSSGTGGITAFDVDYLLVQ